MVSIDSTRRTSIEFKGLTYEDGLNPTFNPTTALGDDNLYSPRSQS